VNFRARLNRTNSRQQWFDDNRSYLDQVFPHWMESLDGIFTTDFFYNRYREALARALFRLDNNDNVIFLGIGNTIFFKAACS
jgi:hypothetical protein